MVIWIKYIFLVRQFNLSFPFLSFPFLSFPFLSFPFNNLDSASIAHKWFTNRIHVIAYPQRAKSLKCCHCWSDG
ncbi:MAG TPA: hypothetical protein DCW66_05735 [Sphingobacterium sp.]|nr:hypothetical protein [Sphingobacterium sp.]